MIYLSCFIDKDYGHYNVGTGIGTTLLEQIMHADCASCPYWDKCAAKACVKETRNVIDATVGVISPLMKISVSKYALFAVNPSQEAFLKM